MLFVRFWCDADKWSLNCTVEAAFKCHCIDQSKAKARGAHDTSCSVIGDSYIGACGAVSVTGIFLGTFNVSEAFQVCFSPLAVTGTQRSFYDVRYGHPFQSIYNGVTSC